MRVAAGLLVPVLLALAACGTGTADSASASAPLSSAAASPTLTPSATAPTTGAAVEYGSLDDLHQAVDAAGYPCDDWAQDDLVTNAAESGSCSDDDVLSTYVTDSDLQDQVDQYQENNEMLEDADIDPSTVLVGPNWIVSGEEEPVQDLRAAIGGRILR